MITDTWTHCYPSLWKGLIVPDAIAHPAKFSSKLIRRIYEHMAEEGWVHPGDHVIDPFGGVALGAFDAMRLGLFWHGVELEPRFAEIGLQNIDLWKSKYAWWKGAAYLHNGDSRDLLRVIAGGDVVVSSPPWGDMLDDARVEQADRRALADDLGLNNSEHVSPIDMEKVGKRVRRGYSAAISSPPYAETTITENRQFTSEQQPSRPNASDLRNAGGDAYGSTPGQLGAMKSGSFDAAISSPPFGAAQTFGSPIVYNGDNINTRAYSPDNQGTSAGNLANNTGDDFWTAARQIVEQTFLALAPGGHACWVVKDYVKAGKRVPFCDQWRQLCESVGFVALHEHRAMLVRDNGSSMTLDGGTVKHQVESKSFFRRLAEKKGSPRIDWETVLCMEKPI